jgi:hypothetical protein
MWLTLGKAMLLILLQAAGLLASVSHKDAHSARLLGNFCPINSRIILL